MDNQVFMDLLAAREYKAVRSILNVMNAVDIAALLEDLSGADLVRAFRLIPKDDAAEVFANMSSSLQTSLVELFTEEELKDMLDDMYLDDTVDLVEDLPANLVTKILTTVSSSRRQQINQLLNYPEDSAGSVMTTEYVSLKKTTTVGDALRLIKQIGIHKETIYTCYVLENRKLIGIVTAKDLLTENDEKTMEELMETELITVTTHTDQEAVGKLFAKYDLLALPVLDSDGMMVGIVTVDDAIDVIEEEATEDIAKMNAIVPTEKTYLETSVFEHAKHRIVWLLVLMISATFTGMILTHYENAFEAIPLLVAFIPMLMDTSGNCGSQASTLIIRGLALDQIHLRDVFRVIFKEFRVSFIVGLTLAVVNFVRIMIMYQDAVIALVVSLSLLLTIMLAKLIGCMMPLLATRLHLDPALMASPLITTIVDACSITIFFAIATAILL